METQNLKALVNFPGYVVDRIECSKERVQVIIRRDARCALRCPHCGTTMAFNRADRARVQDLPWGTAREVWLDYERVQGRCSACSRYATLRPPGVDESRRATTRLMHWVCALSRHLPLNEIKAFCPISAATAYRWDKEVLEKVLPSPDLDGLEVLLVDEKAVRKGHGYVTLVMNGQTGELLHLAEGKKKASLESFIDKLSPEQLASIKAVGIDRAGSYQSVIKQRLPNATIVYDKFHLVANYQAVLDEVRRQAWRKANKEGKIFIKDQRYNLFRNPENLKPGQAADLKRLLAANEDIAVAYLLTDAVKPLWTYTYAKSAENYLDKWCGWAKESGITVLDKFATSLTKAKDHIIAFCKWPITTARLESFNAAVSRVLYKSCGIRNLDYLYLKLRQVSSNTALQY